MVTEAVQDKDIIHQAQTGGTRDVSTRSAATSSTSDDIIYRSNVTLAAAYSASIEAATLRMHNHLQRQQYSFVQRQAMRIARWPKTHFWIAFGISVALSVCGMIVGDFSLDNEQGRWRSRGTLIADRTTQILMVQRHASLLFGGDGTFTTTNTNTTSSSSSSSSQEAVWDELTSNVQAGWQSRNENEEEKQEDARRKLSSFLDHNQGGDENARHNNFQKSNSLHSFLKRRLQRESSQRLEGCNTDWFLNSTTTPSNNTNQYQSRLWPVWKTKDASTSALDPALVEELCYAEEMTQSVLEEQGLCIRCEGIESNGINPANETDNHCLPPYGVVFYTRIVVPGGFDMNCSALAQAWKSFQVKAEAAWKQCVSAIEDNPTGYIASSGAATAEQCPSVFHPSLLDELFDATGNVQYTSTIFATTEDMVDDLYGISSLFGKGGEQIEGVYDTQNQDFVSIWADNAVGSDIMLLATGSAVITSVAMLVHTRSLFLTLVGLIKILLSFPLAFFAYKIVAQLTFFPFLNFIGVFVVFALGAEHVFVAVDKWKKARLDRPAATTQEIAAKALPDAALAMLLTTSATAIAFFGTAICPVAPVRLFAIFCGMIIVFDYVLDVALVLPCLCIYDGYRHNPNCFITFQSYCGRCAGTKNITGSDSNSIVTSKTGDDTGSMNADKTYEMILAEFSDGDSTADEPNSQRREQLERDEEPIRGSLIRRSLLAYYNMLHRLRWPLLAASTIAFCVCIYFATKLELPTSVGVRLFSSDVEYEKAHLWRQNLLSAVLNQQGGSLAYVLWGVAPADTGDHNDPTSWTSLVLDSSFDPSTPQAQIYLRDFCPKFFAQEFAGLPSADFECPINRFDAWLKDQSSVNAAGGIYEKFCDGATGLPTDPRIFHTCIVAWGREAGETSVLARNGVVNIMSFPFNSRVRFDSPNSELQAEWNLIENWITQDQKNAPREVANGFFSSSDFWWFDTNLQMFKTAYGSAGIAIAASALVILLSSRSLVMTLLSTLSIGYVLASVTSMMVALGWTLGFLESLCFSILIGVSVDFVIHFSHAYVAIPGEVCREIRTKHALIEMGPSVLAAAFTTLASALIMLFCDITFFTKFAFVLFFTIVQATVGSFVVFFSLTDCIGPAQPTFMANWFFQKCRLSTNNRGGKNSRETRSVGETVIKREKSTNELEV